MTLYLDLRLVLGQLLQDGEFVPIAPGPTVGLSAWSIALGQSATSAPISAQLQPNRSLVGDDRLARLRLGRLLAFGMVVCLGAIDHAIA